MEAMVLSDEHEMKYKLEAKTNKQTKQKTGKYNLLAEYFFYCVSFFLSSCNVKMLFKIISIEGIICYLFK